MIHIQRRVGAALLAGSALVAAAALFAAPASAAVAGSSAQTATTRVSVTPADILIDKYQTYQECAADGQNGQDNGVWSTWRCPQGSDGLYWLWVY